MNKFLIKSETPRDTMDWGTVAWLSHPPLTQNKQITALDVELTPGEGHDFHYHPGQEEVIVIIKGTVEQWVGEEMRMLNPGDAVFIDADMVHASFNNGDEPAYLIAILGPCVGEIGYGVVEVADQAPWNSLRV
ncbi:MAG: cupin domain-containing protein [Chloroflexota bacterium]